MHQIERTPEQIYDEWLVIRSQDGEREAFAELVGRWHARLVGFAVGVTGRDDVARDAVQAAWIAAARDITKLNDPARFPEWICRVVRNKCVDCVRRAQRVRRVERGRAAEESAGIVNPSVAASDLEEEARVRRAIAGLGASHREILGLYYGASLGVARIAAMHGVPPGTVKSRLHAARNELRSILERKQQ